jgi:hypothetical protein
LRYTHLDKEQPMGHALTVDLPEDVYESLLRTAREANQPPAAVAAQLLAEITKAAGEDPLARFIGAFDSQGSDWADRHDAHLAESVMEAPARR